MNSMSTESERQSTNALDQRIHENSDPCGMVAPLYSRRECLGLLLGPILIIHSGCARHRPVETVMPTEPAPFQQFVAPNFDWSTVKRVVLMPMANQTAFAQASAELQQNLAAELQRAGRFDVVMETEEDSTARSRDVFARGSFDELELLRIAREHDAQAILFGLVTQYHPYPPPRVGLSLIMISPGEGVAIASADGLWDAREAETAHQAQAYLHQKLNWRQSLMGVDRALESPDVYQRFVCQQVAMSLNPPGGGGPANSGVLPQLSNEPTAILPASHQSFQKPATRSLPHPNNKPRP